MRLGLVEAWDATGRPRRQWDDTRREYTEWDESGELVENRPYNVEENAAADARLADAQAQATTAATLTERMGTALANNQAYLALASPTAAQSQAQVRALTRQMNAAIRYITGRLESTDDT